LDPSLQPLFNSDMKVQGQKLMSTINLAVVSLHKLDDILPAVQALGKQHAAEYGVPDSSYETVGAALLWTLGQGLGEAFTPEAMDAWAETYSLLANTMIQAAHAPSA
ncbi:MAG: hypothetical protein KDB23_29375, partial [Planctomycetales bacterium]|nr:hypothetical protein [Planctomycetales bacterium]